MILNGEILPTAEGLRENFCCKFLQSFPTRSDAMKTCPAVRGPATRWCPTAANAIDAMQPHCAQSGLPPNWHGVILVIRSAEMIPVVLAKMHSRGLRGGDANSRMTASGISNFGYLSRNCRSSVIAATR